MSEDSINWIFYKNISDTNIIKISNKGDVIFEDTNNKFFTKRRIDISNFNFELTENDINNLFKTTQELYNSHNLVIQELDSLITSKLSSLNVN